MNIIEINSVNYGSTGGIMLGVATIAREQGHRATVCVPSSRDNSRNIDVPQIYIGNRFTRNIHRVLGLVTGFRDCFSFFSTVWFIRRLRQEEPDVIHLHNLHDCFINLNLLFRYIKQYHIHVVWTLHDCWAMTGQCPYFTIAKCEKWKNGCHDCPQIKVYPSSMVDRTKWMWKHKKKWFAGVENMTIVTPSNWLASIVRQSFLKEYPVKVIHNGINLSVFKPTQNNFRRRYHLEDQKIVLGVAASWGKRKGLDVLIKLSTLLDIKYKIVIVGPHEGLELADRIIAIDHTTNQKELAEVYSAADVFVNPTREDNFPTVNLEALACGTPVVTFNSGGSPECIDSKSGIVVECEDVPGMQHAIIDICEHNYFSEEDCVNRSQVFDKDERFNEYIQLFNHMLSDRDT